MPLSLHTLTGRTKTAQQDDSDIGELYARMVIRAQEAQLSICSTIFGGVFERFPELKKSRRKMTSLGCLICS